MNTSFHGNLVGGSSLRSRTFAWFSVGLLASIGSTLSAHAAVPKGGLLCQQLPDLFAFYASQHYSQPKLDDSLRAKSIDQFVKLLDPSKTTLLAKDVDRVKSEMGKLYKTLEKGDCRPLVEVFKLVSQRTKESEDFVRLLLGKSYKVDDAATFKSDPDKRDYAKTEKERNDLLAALVHFQVSNSLISRAEKSEAEKMAKSKEQILHRYELATKRVNDRGVDEYVSVFAEAFARALDPHSSYLPKDEMEDFQIQMQLSLEGIGVSLSNADGYVTVEEIIPGGSADRAKALMPQDKITAVAEGEKGEPVSVIDMDLRDVVKKIRGKKGTKVKLTILRQGTKTETFTVTLARDKVDMSDQAAKIFFEKRKVGDKTYKIGILDLPSFYGGRDKNARSGYRDVKLALEKAKKENVDGLILDLSRNGGGLLDDAVRISGLFLRKGNVVATQDTRRTKEILSDDDEGITYSGPLIVLTTRGSASASEILAGALKDYNRALIVGGDHTFGKGSVQVFQGLPGDLGAMKVTTGMFFLPRGVSTQHSGVASDIELPSAFLLDNFGEKSLDNSLPPSKIDSFASIGDANYAATDPRRWKPLDGATISYLAEASKKRVATDPKFLEAAKELEEAKKNQGIVKVGDLRKRSEEDKKKVDAEKKKNAGRRKRGVDLEVPQVQESLRIMSDWLAHNEKGAAPLGQTAPSANLKSKAD